MSTETFNQLYQVSEAPNIVFEEEMQGGGDDDMDMDEYEQEMHAIFQKAREYRNRMSVVEDQTGGRGMNPKVEAMGKIGRALRDSGKFKELSYRDFISIGSIIYYEAQKKVGSDDVEKILKLAMELIKTPDEYVAIFKSRPPKEKKAKKPKKTQMSSLF